MRIASNKIDEHTDHRTDRTTFRPSSLAVALLIELSLVVVIVVGLLEKRELLELLLMGDSLAVANEPLLCSEIV